jgi:hypothetical protein
LSQPAGSTDSEVVKTTGLDLDAGLDAGTEAFFFDMIFLRYRKTIRDVLLGEQK